MSPLTTPVIRCWQAQTEMVRAMLTMTVGTFFFVAMQSMLKFVGKDMPAFEMAFFRNLFGFVVFVPTFLRYGFRILRTDRPGSQILRGFLQGCGMLAFFTGVTQIPLALVTALSFAAPLFAAILAVLFLGERIRLRRFAALFAGFAGVMIVLRPGIADVSVGALLIVASSFFWGMAIVTIKSMAKTESSLTLTAYMGIVMTPLTLVPALFDWIWPTPEQYLWLLAIGACGTIGHVAFAQAMRSAESTAVLPLDFLRLVWASLIGFMVFGEVPDFWAWVGGTVIFASATYIAWREAALARARASAPPEAAPKPA